MYHAPYGPRGAESEQDDFWTDIMEGGDMLPGMMPSEPNAMKKESSARNRTEDTEDTGTTENREWFEMSDQDDEQPEDNDF
nr:hypothetical protein [uncultured Gemmiger sp.]